MTWPDDVLDIRIRIALDADRSVDWTTWDWTDISAYGREAGRIVISQGDADEFGETPPATCALVLDNIDGRFFRRNPTGPYYGRFGRSTPIWVEVDPGTGYQTRFLGEVAAWPKRWDVSATDATVTIQCAGVSRRLGQGDAEVISAATRFLAASEPVAYWPLEDGEDASTARSGIPGGPVMTIRQGVMDFDSDAPPGASGSIKPQVNALNALVGTVAGASSSAWQVSCWTKGVPANSAADAYYVPLEIRTSNNIIFRFAMQHDDDVSMPAVGVGYWTSETETTASAFVGWQPDPVGAFYSRMGEWTLIQFTLTQSGGNCSVALYVDGTLRDSATWSSLTAGAPVRINAIGAFSGANNIVSENMADIWVSQIAVHNGSTLVDQYQAGIGYPGEGAADRIERLCGEAGVPVIVVGDTAGEPMAVQAPGTLMALLRACEAADGGTLQDNPAEPGLLYIPRAERYHLASWELDFDDADIGDVPEATDDDQRAANQVTATRPGGGSYVARAEDDIEAYGIVVDDPISPAVWQDAQLSHQAGWRLHLDQVDEDRWPRISLNFARRPELIAGWVTALPGQTRARISGMPGQVEPVDVIIEGWTETISQVEWRADLFCSPASPWTVGIVEDEVLGRVDTDGSEWVADVDAGTDTSALVLVTAGPPWINSTGYAAMFPVDIRSAGVVLSVTGIAAAVADAFGRTVAAGSLGTATTGQLWSIVDGTPANFSVSSNAARIALTSTNALHTATIPVGHTDHDPRYEVTCPVVPAGAAIAMWVYARWVDGSNNYYATLAINTDATVDLRLFKRVSGSATQLGDTVRLSPVHTAGATWVLQIGVLGSAVRCRAWRSDWPEERGWFISVTDSDLATGTDVAVGCRRETGNSNGSQTMVIDNFAVPSLQTFTFEGTPVNGVEKTIPAGESLSLAHPWRLAL